MTFAAEKAASRTEGKHRLHDSYINAGKSANTDMKSLA
jgi:hypothetical protein